MTGMLRALTRMITGETTRSSEDTHIWKVSMGTPPRTSLCLTNVILIDAKRRCWSYLPVGQATSNWGISLEEVSPATFYWNQSQTDGT